MYVVSMCVLHTVCVYHQALWFDWSTLWPVFHCVFLPVLLCSGCCSSLAVGASSVSGTGHV